MTKGVISGNSGAWRLGVWVVQGLRGRGAACGCADGRVAGYMPDVQEWTSKAGGGGKGRAAS